jgi:hypothetical protein
MSYTAEQIVNQIVKSAEKAKPRLADVTEMKVGEVVRQGDLYIERISRLPKERGAVTEDSQLAVGQTQGSRHIISPKPKGLVIYAPAKGANVLTGPIVKSSVAWNLTHPEHGHFAFGPGTFQVTYQKDYAKERAEELRRVQD